MASAAADRESSDASTSGANILPSMRRLLAGPIAGVCSRFVTYAPDTIKARLQVQGAAAGGGPAVYTGTWHAVVQVWRQEGLGGFYRGFGAVALGSVPGNLAYFGAYEAAKGLVPGSASLAGLLTHPADVVKTRLQVLSARADHAHLTAWSLARQMWAAEGPKAPDRVRPGLPRCS
ncbi:Mitochondrial substrate carrier family protein ancA [Tetrabaena socialis]|uniref:Mitochondrial substrate carrier family protein ancA n=1 Tax=Tetrabaena socialis TaxID=47790 RepID=A0A2J8AGB1_9CHLO|nr:Mitochondrial substrate carrier family protein ancA [Tetrabaena socialis]|eukprot:PNH11542.1 Mitochondrial substrate carrier family protein ancA [Tetrabaena socialis]